MPFRLISLVCLALLSCSAEGQSSVSGGRIEPVQQSITVRAETADQPDPATASYRREDLLPASPGRPGVPFSIPGFPSETASGGIKAPQYFAPGVAGDHGEPVAQFLDLDGFLIPNNLTANAHGNGYADPNLMIAPTLEGATADSGAFNALYGDHAINLAVTYTLRARLDPFVQLSTSGKDSDVAAGWAPENTGRKEWLAAQALWGNGWLDRPEHRQQVRFAGLHAWTSGHHAVSLLGIGYEGFSYIPGLIPMDAPTPGQTVDERQQDFTHTELAALSDKWMPSDRVTLRTGGFVRRYGLDLRPNFGDGLIRQSERRWVAGTNSTWIESFGKRPGQWALLGTGGYTLEAPHDLMLEHVVDVNGELPVPGNASGDAPSQFVPVTRNDLTIQGWYGAGAISGRLAPALHVYAGGRYDRLCFRNSDWIVPAHGFDRCVPTTNPKLSAEIGHADRRGPIAGWLPEVAISYARAFHANDPRIGAMSGASDGSLLISAHEWQGGVRKKIASDTELRVVFARVANAGELAKLDPDTGLQENIGPALNRFVTVELTHRQSSVFWQANWSEADARDRIDGSPVPEAPRMIADTSATLTRLPRRLTAQAEFEFVKAKPLGDGITGTSLTELRLGVYRGWRDGRLTVGVQGQFVDGFTGQTTETLALPGEPAPFERSVGVPGASYASATLRWKFR